MKSRELTGRDLNRMLAVAHNEGHVLGVRQARDEYEAANRSPPSVIVPLDLYLLMVRALATTVIKAGTGTSVV